MWIPKWVWLHFGVRKPQLKFERNPCNKFRHNRCHRRTTDGRTTDEFRFHELCWHSQAELNFFLHRSIVPHTKFPLFSPREIACRDPTGSQRNTGFLPDTGSCHLHQRFSSCQSRPGNFRKRYRSVLVWCILLCSPRNSCYTIFYCQCWNIVRTFPPLRRRMFSFSNKCWACALRQWHSCQSPVPR